MTDRGVEMTEERLDEIRDRLKKTYKEAEKDLRKKAEEHTAKFAARDAQKLAERDAGKITQEQYLNWVSGQVFIGKQWKSKVDQMARSLVHVEETAVQIVRDGQLGCFADNANFVSFSIDKDTGFNGSFGLYDEATVAKLIEEEPELLRRRYVDGQKCEAWNVKVISNCITQGIIQGESIEQIAKRMARDTASTDMKAMTRYARTAMTGAQNAGRMRAMEDSLEQGIEVKKLWIATLDERTRDAHADLDGQIVDVKEPFDSELGPIMYPGDPGADDANVWNCRCTLGWEYPDSPSKGKRYDQEEGEVIDDMDYDEWFEWRKDEIKQNFSYIPLFYDYKMDNGVIERRSYNGIEKYDIDAKQDVEVEDRSVQAIDDAARLVIGEIPALDNYVRTVVFGKLDDDNPAEFNLVIDNGYPGLAITCSADRWKSFETLKNFVVSEAASKRHIQTDQPGAIIAHEYGHAAVTSYALKIAGYNGYGQISGVQMNKFVNSVYLIRDDINGIIESKGSTFLSEAAKKDFGEYVAEAFSDYFYGEKKPVSVAIVDYFKEGLQ